VDVTYPFSLYPLRTAQLGDDVLTAALTNACISAPS